MGPNLLWHLGGGEGGIAHFMDTLMGPMTAMWKVLGDPQMTPALEQVIVEGVLEEAGDRSIDQLAAARDAMLIELEATRAKHGKPGRPIAATDPRNP
jgi:hypothetical protein